MAVRRRGNRFVARVKANGAETHLGSYTTEREASEAVESEKQRMREAHREEASSLGAREVPWAPGYFVTESGVVYSGHHRYGKSLRRLVPGLHRGGYPNYGICINGKALTKTAHRLVASVWLPQQPSPEHGIRHLDGNPQNNHASNLQWGTQLENIHDKWEHGTMASGERNGRHTKPERVLRGERAPGAKLTAAQVTDVRCRLAAGETGVSIARSLGVLKTTISAIKNGRTWKEAA